MKTKTIFTLAILITFLFSCSSDSNSSANNNQVGSETTFVFENSTFNGNALITYTDGTTTTGNFINGNMSLPISTVGQKIITSIQPQNEAYILIGRKEGSDVHLNYSNGILSHRVAINGFIPIGTYAEFQLINDSQTTLAGNYKLEVDIDFMNIQWTPIGSTSASFKGNFDGNNHNILNLFVNNTGMAGLFGFATNYPLMQYIKNLTIASGNVKGGPAGGIIGVIEGGLNISNCQNYAIIEGESAGGIIGESNSGSTIQTTITDSQNYGTIISSGIFAGGIAANTENIINCQNYGIISTTNVVNYNNGSLIMGGIAGRCFYITNCFNQGSVINTSNQPSTIGGICGISYKDILGCYNSGALSSQIGGVLGGIIGETQPTPNNKIIACYNTGYISGNGIVGGIVGHWGCNNSTIEACYNTGEIYNPIERGYSVGTGGIIGIVGFPGLPGGIPNVSNIRNCYNVGRLLCPQYSDGISASGGVVGYFYTANQMSITGCFWKNMTNDGVEHSIGTLNNYYSGISYNLNTGTNLFNSTSWPSPIDNWLTGNGTNGTYWKTLGSWNNDIPIYPKLYYEN